MVIVQFAEDGFNIMDVFKSIAYYLLTYKTQVFVLQLTSVNCLG